MIYLVQLRCIARMQMSLLLSVLMMLKVFGKWSLDKQGFMTATQAQTKYWKTGLVGDELLRLKRLTFPPHCWLFPTASGQSEDSILLLGGALRLLDTENPAFCTAASLAGRHCTGHSFVDQASVFCQDLQPLQPCTDLFTLSRSHPELLHV